MLMVRRGEESKRKRIEGEQRRRSDIRDLLDALKAVLPPDSSQPGNYGRAQSETLQHAANHIEYLSATSVGLQERVTALQAVYEDAVRKHEQLTGKRPAQSLPILLPRSSTSVAEDQGDLSADDVDADADDDDNDTVVEMHAESLSRKGKQTNKMDRHLHTFPVEASTSSSSVSSSQQLQQQHSPSPPISKRMPKQLSVPSGGTRRASKSNRYDPISRGSRPSTSKRREPTPPPHLSTAAVPRIVSDPSPRVLHPPSFPSSSSLSPPQLRLPSLNHESPRRFPSLNLDSPHRQPLPSPYRPPPPLVTPASNSIGPARTVRKPSMRYDPIRDVHVQREPPPPRPRDIS